MRPVQPAAVWVIASDATFHALLCDVMRQAGFTVLEAGSLAGVCRNLVRGTVGVVVADATDLFRSAGDRARLDEYCYLSATVPVLLLTNDPETVAETHDALAQCEILALPVDDLDHLAETVEAVAHRLNLSLPAIGSAF